MHLFFLAVSWGLIKMYNMFPERTYCVRGLSKAKEQSKFYID
jgi:hypothetical protein